MKPIFKTLAIVLAVIVFAPTHDAVARGSDGLYRTLIARHCVAVARDKSERYTELTGYIHSQTVKIRDVRSLAGSWIRVYAIAQSAGRVALGHMDYNTRNGQVRCPSGNFVYNHLPLWDLLNIR